MWTDGTNAGAEGSGVLLREEFRLGPVIRLCGTVGSAPVQRAGDPGSNPGPGGNFSLKLTTYKLPKL